MSEALKEITGLTLRMGPEGPEMQVIYGERGGSTLFYKLDPDHVEYLFINLQFFMKQMRTKALVQPQPAAPRGHGAMESSQEYLV